jgi:hypothetical protein
MLKNRLGIKNVPNSIYKLTSSDDKESLNTLKTAVESNINNLNMTQTMNKVDPRKKFEIKLSKAIKHKEESVKKRLQVDGRDDSNSGTLIGDQFLNKQKDLFQGKLQTCNVYSVGDSLDQC